MLKAYLTTIGEPTTALCKSQLEKLGFEVVLLDKKEDWPTKYKRFIDLANEDCLRIDADIVLFNDFNVETLKKDISELNQDVIAQYQVVHFSKFKIHTGQPLYYSKRILEIAKGLPVSAKRPETAMWRRPEIISYTKTIEKVVGLHQFPMTKL